MAVSKGPCLLKQLTPNSQTGEKQVKSLIQFMTPLFSEKWVKGKKSLVRLHSQSPASCGCNDLCTDDGGFADKGLVGRSIGVYRVRSCAIEEGRAWNAQGCPELWSCPRSEFLFWPRMLGPLMLTMLSIVRNDRGKNFVSKIGMSSHIYFFFLSQTVGTCSVG